MIRRSNCVMNGLRGSLLQSFKGMFAETGIVKLIRVNGLLRRASYAIDLEQLSSQNSPRISQRIVKHLLQNRLGSC